MIQDFKIYKLFIFKYKDKNYNLKVYSPLEKAHAYHRSVYVF